MNLQWSAFMIGLCGVLPGTSNLGFMPTALGQNTATLPPKVEITFPDSSVGESLPAGAFVRVKADAFDPDGFIVEVQFFAGPNLIGIATNAPYSVGWNTPLAELVPETVLTAVAIDNLGASTVSAPLHFYLGSGAQPHPLVRLLSPTNGVIFPAPATFEFAAEVLVSAQGDSRTDFYIGTNLVKHFSRAPLSLMVTNLPEGEYMLSVKFVGDYGLMCQCPSAKVHVVKLGLRSSSVNPIGQFQSEVVTGFPNQKTIVEGSTNFQEWLPVGTNSPPTNVFSFSDSNTIGFAHRFYRVVVPP